LKRIGVTFAGGETGGAIGDGLFECGGFVRPNRGSGNTSPRTVLFRGGAGTWMRCPYLAQVVFFPSYCSRPC